MTLKTIVQVEDTSVDHVIEIRNKITMYQDHDLGTHDGMSLGIDQDDNTSTVVQVRHLRILETIILQSNPNV